MITIKKIKAHVLNEWGANIPWHQLRRYLKQQKKLSYKKGWARRIDLDQNRLSYLRILYSIRLAKQLNEKILLINIDEVNFTTEVSNNRSWLKRGINCEIFSQKYSGAVSVVLAINSDGDYLAAALKERLNSNIFIEFLKIMNLWIESNDLKFYKRVLVLLDNCPIHRSSKTIQYMRTTKLWYMFLPVYTPSLAPVELVFANLKRRIAWIDTNEITNWNSIEGTKILKKSLNEIESNEIINCWTHSLNVSEKYIDCFKHHILNQKSMR